MSSREHLGVRAVGRARFARVGGRARAPLVIRESAALARRRDLRYRRALLGADLAAALATVAVAEAMLRDGGLHAATLVLLPVTLLVNTAAGLYRRDESVLSTTTLDDAPAHFQAATLSVVLTFLVTGAAIEQPVGPAYVAVVLATLTALTLALRTLARGLARRVSDVERCLVVGEREDAARLAGLLRTAPTVKAVVAGRWAPGDGQRLDDVVMTSGAQRVVVAGDGAAAEQVHEIIQLAKGLGVKVSLLPRTFDVVGSSVTFDHLGGMTLLGVQRVGLSRRARLAKRGLDCAVSAALLVAAAPLMAVIAVAIKLDSAGPVLFRQVRVGRDGRVFRIFKFRSMFRDAEARKEQLRVRNEAVGLFKIAADPRITRVGGLLRRSCLDELPQLLNVLRGEMSLVGPRPLVVDEDRQIRGWQRRRLELTPGVTGPWQVLGAARIPLDEMLTIDYLYVVNWSLWGDVKLLLRTIPCVLARRGQ